MDAILQYMLSGLVIGSIYGLIGVGFVVIYNATGIINFAQGDFATLGALLAISLSSIAGLPLWLDVLLAVAIVGLVAGAIERFAVRPAGGNAIRGIIITIGVGVALQGLMAVAWGTDAFPLRSFSGSAPLELGGATIPSQSLWVIGITLVVMAALTAFFNHTYVGKLFRASSINGFAASLMGIRTSSMSTLSFVMSGSLGALAGIIVAPITLTQYSSGLTLGIKSFVACIVGGIANPIGVVFGGLLLGVLESFSTGLLSSGYKDAIAFVLLLSFLFLRPQGLFGHAVRGGH